MKLKPLALIVALLAVAAGLVYWRSSTPVKDPSADPRVGQPLVPVDTLHAIHGLRLVSGGQSAVLAADTDGQRWTVPDYFALPADFDKLVSLVNSLRDAKVVRFVTAQPERLERLGFTGDLIELRDAEAKPLLTINLGKNNESGGRFVRLGDEPKAYLVELNTWLDAVAKNWARSQLLDVKPEAIASVECRFADGTSVVARRSADGTAWTADGLPEGKELKASAVDSLVSQLTALRFTETAEPAAPDAVAAREHARTVVVTTKDGTSYTVALGRRPAPPATPETGDRRPETAKPGPISVTTPPVTIGPDGKPQVVELPPEITAQEATAETVATPPPPPPPGPVFAFIAANREADPINAIMQKRAFQIGEWTLNSLPVNRDALLQDKPAPLAAPAAATAQSADPVSTTPAPSK